MTTSKTEQNVEVMDLDSAADKSSNRTRSRRFPVQVGGPVIGLVVMVIALSLLSPYFLTVRNLSNVLSQISDVGILAA